jgi:uncharacterized membrane protein YcaP (DUF421 family)
VSAVAEIGSPTAAILVVVAACTAGIYLFLITLLRLAGRRQLAQLSALDLVVVLLLGSAVETAMIHGDTSLLAGLVSAATLLVLNRLLSLLFLRSSRLSHLVNGGPILLVHDGRVLDSHLARAGLTTPDLAAALRARGYEGPAGVVEAVLETDGSISVVGEARPAP